MISPVLVRLDDGRGPLAWLDPTPTVLGPDGHVFDSPLFPDGCMLCGASSGAADSRCPEADAVLAENDGLTAYAALYCVTGPKAGA